MEVRQNNVVRISVFVNFKILEIKVETIYIQKEIPKLKLELGHFCNDVLYLFSTFSVSSYNTEVCIHTRAEGLR